jgi:acetyl-CoA synthetase
MNSLVEQLTLAGLDDGAANHLATEIEDVLTRENFEAAWSRVSREILNPDMPFDIHQAAFNYVYKSWEEGPPKPVWIPTEVEIAKTNAYKFLSGLGLSDYPSLHAWSNSNEKEFWEKITKVLDIQFSRPFVDLYTSKDVENPGWFSGAMLNIADSCFNRDNKDQAITYQNEHGSIERWTFGELQSLSNRVAQGLRDQHIEVGDAVAVDMVMTAEAVAIYLGAVLAGCAVVSIPDSLAPDEIKKRLKISKAKVMFTQDVLLRAGKELPLYEKILKAHPASVVVVPAGNEMLVSLEDGHRTWEDFLSDQEDFQSVQCHPMDHINILFSSGTTGDPKAIPWNHTTPIKCAADGYFHHDIHHGDVVAWPTNLGWMMGPWLIFAAFLNKASIALYYGAPMGSEFGEFVRDAKVNMLGVVPSMVKHWRNSGALKGIDWTGINNFSSTGESSNADDMFWLMAKAGYKPVIEYCGGTEIGGGYLSSSMLQPAAPSFFTSPGMGLDFHIMDEEGRETDQGEVFISGLSLGLSVELLNQDHHKVYFEDTPKAGSRKLRRHGDEIEITKSGFYRAHGRVDDTMNLGGIKVSSIEIERTLNALEDIAETAAIAVTDHSGGPSQLVIYTVLNAGAILNIEQLRKSMQKLIREKLNPLFKIHEVVEIESLPRTASNKVMRRVLRRMFLEAMSAQ